MRILWVKAGGIVPADTGGRIRSLHILKELARRHSVTLFTYYAAHPGDLHRNLRGFSEVVAVPIALPRERTLRDYVRYARTVSSSDPYSMQVIGGESGGRLRSFDVAEMRQRLANVIAGGDFDVLICDFIYPAGLIDWDSGCPKILFTHNVEAELWRQQYEMAHHPLKRFLYWKEWRALRGAEAGYAQKADHVLTVSEQNRAYFSRYMPEGRVSTIATGVDIDSFHQDLPHPEPDFELPPAMVFTGSMDWMPNQHGILFFASEILPRIRAEVPDADLWIVGRCPSQEVLALAGPRTQVTGRVDDIRPYLRKSPVYVVPLLSGSGTRIKIFEAMAMGRAVVSTTIGAEGLPVTHGQNILIADHPREFADSVVRLLRDHELAAKLGGAARALVETQFSWKTVGSQFHAILENVVYQNQFHGSETRKTA